jgi:hypothetical protein
MEQFYLFLMLSVPLAAILYFDRKNAKKYLLLGAFTMMLAIPWESSLAYLGFWRYFSEPRLFGVSIYTILLYTHYVIFSYFLGNILFKRCQRC